MPIRALVFDAYGTLCDVQSVPEPPEHLPARALAE
jgi:FMN phosphatase YigB (HAD superfamily)